MAHIPMIRISKGGWDQITWSKISGFGKKKGREVDFLELISGLHNLEVHDMSTYLIIFINHGKIYVYSIYIYTYRLYMSHTQYLPFTTFSSPGKKTVSPVTIITTTSTTIFAIQGSRAEDIPCLRSSSSFVMSGRPTFRAVEKVEPWRNDRPPNTDDEDFLVFLEASLELFGVAGRLIASLQKNN